MMREISKATVRCSLFCLCLIFATWLSIMDVYSDQSASANFKLDLKDPLQRNATQLLESAHSKRSKNRLEESVALGFLALKAAKAESNASLESRSHLFLSESMSMFGYRAMERIHAKAAYRAMQRSNSVSLKLEKGPFYIRLGAVAKDSGDYAIADFYLKKALATYNTKEPKNKKSIVLTLLELAKLSLKRAETNRSIKYGSVEYLGEARDYIDRAMELAKDTSDAKILEGAILDVQAQAILRMSGHLPGDSNGLVTDILVNVEKMLRESLARLQLHSERTLRQQVPVMNALVSVLRRTGRYVEAMDVVENILDITDKLKRVDVNTVLNMALVARNQENDTLIRTVCHIVMNSEESKIAEVASYSSEALALAFSVQSRYRSMTCLALLSTLNTEKNANARTMLDLVLRSKAIVTESEGGYWETLHGQSDTDLSAALTTLVSLRNRLSTKVVTGDAVGLWRLIQEIEHGEELLAVETWWRGFQGDDASEEGQAVQGYAEALLKGMSPWDAISAQKHQFEERRVTINLIAKNIPRDAVLVEFAKIDNFDLAREVFTAGSHYWAFILYPNGQTKAVNLGDAGYIETQIASNLKVLASADRLLAEPQLLAMSKLYNVVWAPLVGKLGKIKNIILSPDSVFALLPFSALLAPDGRFLIEQLTFYQIATGRELVDRNQKQSKKPNAPVIIADPDFNAGFEPIYQDSEGKRKRVTIREPLRRLASTIKEAKKVRELLGSDVEFITGKDASETTVRLVKKPIVLHMATHGLFLKQTISPKETLNEEDAVALESAYVQHVQALSLSGLAFSGINRGGMGKEDDGLLTAFDVAGMDLSGTELVVLSACDTGLGDVLTGEGVLGLRRAFRIAGAQYVLMSLWKLSDKEAVRQMQAFYKAYSAGENPVVALRDTQIARISKLRKVLGHAPPALWGAYTIQGMSPVGWGEE